jgi:hypothetical protein
MSFCFCISDEPVDDVRGRYKSYQTDNKFQTDMVKGKASNRERILITSYFEDECSLLRRLLYDDLVLWAIHPLHLWAYSSSFNS